ncbi:MAG: hypothetical protein ACJA01_004212, partial [Saprospiraceae bacterium]
MQLNQNLFLIGIRPSYPNLHKRDSLMTFVSKDKDANKLQG